MSESSSRDGRMRSFWDLNEALKCIQEGESHVNKLRKPEAVRALAAMAWFVRSIPGAPELLQEVRALAGRVTDGLDKPGTADYVDHPWRALMAQKGLTPYSYTLHLKQSGVPQAPPPLPGHAPAWSYVPGAGQDAIASSGEQEEEDSIFSGLGTLTGPGGDGSGGGCSVGGGDDGGGQVSAPIAHDDHERVGVVDDSVQATGNVRAPAATDPLVDAGSTVGRNGAGQSQDQAGAQVQGPGAAANKKKLCKSVWRDDVCRVKECDRAHPPRCGDPGCFPMRRPSCQHWHRLGEALRQQQPQQQHQQQRQQQQRGSGQQLQQLQQHQGNGSSAGPGRAGRQQAQGRQRDRRPRQGRQGQQQQQQQRQQHSQRVRRGGWQQRGSQQQQQQPQKQRQQQRQQPLGGMQQRRPHQWQQQQQQQQGPTYRDVAARGATGSVWSGVRDGGSVRAQLPSGLVDAVVAAVMAVVADGGLRETGGDRRCRC